MKFEKANVAYSALALVGGLSLVTYSSQEDPVKFVHIAPKSQIESVERAEQVNLEIELDHTPYDDSRELHIVYQKSPNFRKGRSSDIEKIVLHSTEGSGEGALSWMCNPISSAASHYLVMEDGEVYWLVDDADTAWHVGKKANPYTLGIEIAGYAHREGFEFTDAQYDSAGKLCAHLMSKHDLKESEIVPHSWISENVGGTNHTDPGENFDWEKFYASLREHVDKGVIIN